MEWISIKDELPKNESQFIGYYLSKYNGSNCIYTCYYKDDKFYDDLIDITGELTHWMPLPNIPL